MSEPIKADLRKLFSELRDNNNKEDKPSKEWFTTNQFADINEVQNNWASVLIRQATRRGELEMRMFKVKCGQVVRPVPHYRKIVK